MTAPRMILILPFFTVIRTEGDAAWKRSAASREGPSFGDQVRDVLKFQLEMVRASMSATATYRVILLLHRGRVEHFEGSFQVENFP